MQVRLRFEGGTLVVEGDPAADLPALSLPGCCRWDPRVGRWRAMGQHYRDVYAALHRLEGTGTIGLQDDARGYATLSLEMRRERTPRPYQTEAVEAWRSAGRRGVVVLPTGAGKSDVAERVMRAVERSTLVVVPTIDLMNQWYDGLLTAFALEEVGLLGGGYHDVRPVTVTTYDSAAIHLPRYGDRFGLLVFDEVHHLPGPSWSEAARAAIAPFRLGLTATPERQDGREDVLEELVGPVVYRRSIRELAGEFLAEYEVEQVTVHLTEDERLRYDEMRGIYLEFVRSSGVNFAREGWGGFVRRSSGSREGRRAMRAYREQRRIALTCSRKLEFVERTLARHAHDRVIVFTNDNDTVYALSRALLLPAITHQTPTRERREILQRFNDGTYPAVVTARVLNEGVDVPEANVAVVLSGSGSVREHVQRLGRILRKREGKRARLYEVTTADTVEQAVSERRREHDAYR